MSSPRLLQHDRCRFMKCIVCCSLPALLPAAVGGGGPFSNALVSFANEGWPSREAQRLPDEEILLSACVRESAVYSKAYLKGLIWCIMCCAAQFLWLPFVMGCNRRLVLLICSWLLKRNTSEHLIGKDLEEGNGLRNGLDIYIYKQAHSVLFNNVKPTFVQGIPVLESYASKLVLV